MNNTREISKITGIFQRGASEPVVKALAAGGISSGHMAVGRSAMLMEKKSMLGVERSVITEDPIEILSFLTTTDSEEAALATVIKTGGLSTPGRGMAFSEKVTLVEAHPLCAENKPSGFKSAGESRLLSDLVEICCIVQRGQGNAVAKVSLDTGTCVPAITFGHGTGVRDKLGILRITIPAEKEVVNIVASRMDADAVMNLMVDVGKLDQPGKGFIYYHPIGKGVVNTKITIGMPKHAASIEQIISVIDEMKGGAVWRSRSGTADGDGKGDRPCLTNLIDMTLLCDEGRGEDLVKAAMSVGAAGATISKQKHICPEDSGACKVSPARESCNLIIGEAQIPTILEAVTKAGAFDDKSHGLIYHRPAPKAITFLGKK